MPRPDTSNHPVARRPGTLPEYEVLTEKYKMELDGKTRTCVDLKCKRCSGAFTVSVMTMRNAKISRFITRACPYCFRTNILPESLYPREPRIKPQP